MHEKRAAISASQIAVKQAHVTLIWPLTLHMKEPPEQAATVDRTVMGFAADLADAFHRAPEADREHMWQPVSDPIEHIARPKKRDGETQAQFDLRLSTWENDAYAEAVYFHEFIQDFLYRPPKEPQEAPFRLFRRTDLQFARVRFAGGPERDVGVERVNLYLFRTGVAIFTMDMFIPEIDQKAASSGWTLADFQTFHDLVRRAYAPFYVMKNEVRANGHLVLDNIAWLDGNRRVLKGRDGKEWAFDLDDDKSEVPRYLAIKDGTHSRYPPLFRHWRVLLSPDLALADYDRHAEPVTRSGGDVAAARWHHVVDERMATLATVSVTDEAGGLSRYNSIGDGDMVRLCFADSSGSDLYPYDAHFLRDFDSRFAYDRFRSSGTRFLISGYSCVALVAGWFGDNIISMHMRRHYFQMAVLVHMEMASLLSFSGQVSRAVQFYGSDSKKRRKFELSMAAIQEEFLQFMNRFRFTGVSNQLQAQELFTLWRKNLLSDTLFADVNTEISVANDFLRAEASRRSTDSSEWLSLVGGIGVFVGVIVGFMGMNFLTDHEIWRPLLNPGYTLLLPADLANDLVALGGVLAPLGLLTHWQLRRYRRRVPRAIFAPFVRTAAIATVLGLAGLVIGLLPGM